MKPRSVTHASFTIERHFRQAPARVFAAFATEKGKQAGIGETLHVPAEALRHGQGRQQTFCRLQVCSHPFVILR